MSYFTIQILHYFRPRRRKNNLQGRWRLQYASHVRKYLLYVSKVPKTLFYPWLYFSKFRVQTVKRAVKISLNSGWFCHPNMRVEKGIKWWNLVICDVINWKRNIREKFAVIYQILKFVTPRVVPMFSQLRTINNHLVWILNRYEVLWVR